jgi:hypothetical protein
MSIDLAPMGGEKEFDFRCHEICGLRKRMKLASLQRYRVSTMDQFKVKPRGNGNLQEKKVS